MNGLRRKRLPVRRGTTIVETAVVLPVFLLLLFAIFEFGHAQLIKNMLNSSCRNAARIGAVEGTSTNQVISQIQQQMSPVISQDNVLIFVNDAGDFDSDDTPDTDGQSIEDMPSIELSEAEPRQLFVIRARVPYNSVAIVPMPFLEDVQLYGQSFMRHE
jgi:hypothetical protein